MKKHVGVAFFLIASSLVSQNNAALPKPQPNADLTQLFEEDQRVRTGPQLSPEERIRINRTDADRLAAVRQLVATNQLQSGADYLHAAVIMQHGSTSSDYLLGHTLALICAAEGDKLCAWMSAANLDRYLLSIKQPQIYGTQFMGGDHSPETQDPYTPDLIPDSIRKKLGVPSRNDQKKQLDKINESIKKY
jgi:hypothetical protein